MGIEYKVREVYLVHPLCGWRNGSGSKVLTESLSFLVSIYAKSQSWLHTLIIPALGRQGQWDHWPTSQADLYVPGQRESFP